jgi:hypothetical protein
MNCCDLHGRNCEPPSELCCEGCTEAVHQMGDAMRGYHMRDRSKCSNPDLSGHLYPSHGDPDEPRELVGRYVREIWIHWAREQSNPKPSWLLSWEALGDGDREVSLRSCPLQIAPVRRTLSPHVAVFRSTAPS